MGANAVGALVFGIGAPPIACVFASREGDSGAVAIAVVDFAPTSSERLARAALPPWVCGRFALVRGMTADVGAYALVIGIARLARQFIVAVFRGGRAR